MYVYVFIAYVSGSQTLAHIIWSHLEGLLKCRLLGPAQRVSYSRGLGWGLKFAFLTSLQMLMLLVRGSHFENYCGSQREHRKKSTRIVHHNVNRSYLPSG